VENEGGDTVVYVLPVTHSPPTAPDDAVELPQATKVRLGLDSEASWIVVNEVNSFVWPGPDLRPLPGNPPASSAYGMLPGAVFTVVRMRFMNRLRDRRAGMVKRTE
jgi:hypothetical protein